MNNNQIQPTNQPKPNRFHLKTWQWVSVLAVVAVIAAGVFVLWIKEGQNTIQRPLGVTEKAIDDLDLAREVLVEYFSLLNEGKYTEAVKYHGSGYDYMNYEPKLDPFNSAHHPELLKRGCGFLVCENINIIKKEQLSTNEFVFTVQFIYDDGVLKGEIAKRYPYCCGEEPPEGVANIPKTEFEYKVKKVGTNFFVITPLLYIP